MSTNANMLGAVPFALMHKRGFLFDKDGTAAGAATTEKWIKLLQDYDGKKAGEVFSLEPGVADALVKGKLAEATEEPPEVAAQAKGISAAMKDYVDGLVKQAGDTLIGNIRTEFKNAKSGTDKRPHIVTHDNADDDPNFGFKNANEQVRYIKRYCTPEQRETVIGDEKMKRLIVISTKAPTTYVNEGLGADGGFLLAPNFSNQVLAHSFAEEGLLALTDNYTTGSNNLSITRDETTPWGTNGVQVYWTAEAAQLTQSKLKLGQTNLQLQKLTALVPVTDEQLEDSFVGLGQYVTRQGGERIGWATDEALVNGGGVGKPLGFLNSGAIVSVAKETGQTAATFNLANAAKMIARIPSASLANLRWLVHPSVLPQMMTMTNGNSSLWIGPGDVESKGPVLGRFMGIGVVVSQHCQVLGTQGDVFLVDLKKYITLTKGDGIQTAMSMHLYFDYSVSTFRFNFRVAGQPWLVAPITSAYGSFTQSPFVTLDTRA